MAKDPGNSARVKRNRGLRRKAGLVPVTVWVCKEDRVKVIDAVEDLRRKGMSRLAELRAAE